MKTLLTLCMALPAFAGSYAQDSRGTSPPVPVHPLSHEDSLVMQEAGICQMPDPGHADTLVVRPVRILPFHNVIQTVLEDFPHNLQHISGELVLAQGEWENYASTVALADAGSCIVTRYHSVDDTTSSWQAKMLTTDDFKTASKTYQELYKKLERCQVRLVDGSVIYVSGVWEPACEEKAFTTSTLRLETGDWRYKDVKIELELVYLLADWAVNINIVSKKRDDEVGGGHVGALMQ